MNTLDTFAHTWEEIQSPVLAMTLSYQYMKWYKGQTDLLHETAFHILLQMQSYQVSIISVH